MTMGDKCLFTSQCDLMGAGSRFARIIISGAGGRQRVSKRRKKQSLGEKESL